MSDLFWSILFITDICFVMDVIDKETDVLKAGDDLDVLPPGEIGWV